MAYGLASRRAKSSGLPHFLPFLCMHQTEERAPRRLNLSGLVPENPKHFVGPAHWILFRIDEVDEIQLHASKMGDPLRSREVGFALPQFLLGFLTAGNVPVQADDAHNFFALVNQGDFGRLQRFHFSIGVDGRSLGLHGRPAGPHDLQVVRVQGGGPLLRKQIESRLPQQVVRRLHSMKRGERFVREEVTSFRILGEYAVGDIIGHRAQDIALQSQLFLRLGVQGKGPVEPPR